MSCAEFFDQAGELGLGVIVKPVDSYRNWKSTDILDLAMGGLVDGALLISEIGDIGTELSTFSNLEIQTVSVLIDRTQSGIPRVVPRDGDGIYKATELLIRKGHTYCGNIGGPPGSSAEIVRHAAFVRCLTNAGLHDRHIQLLDGQFDLESGDEAAQIFLRLEKRPTAIVSFARPA